MIQISPRLNKVIQVLKWVVPAILLVFIGYRLYTNSSLDSFTDNLLILIQHPIELTLLLVLAVVNWGLEAVKWKVLVQKIERLTLWKSYMSVLLGLGVSLTMPRSVGELFGRLWGIGESGREAAVGALLISRGMQLSTTLLGGFASLLYFSLSGGMVKEMYYFFWVSLAIFVGLISVIVFAFWFSKKETKIQTYLATLKAYSFQTLVSVWSLAVGRFLTYAFQYYLVIHLLVDHMSAVALFAGILLVYLMKSIVLSTHTLSDEVVRQASAIWVFSLIGIGEEPVVVASSTIWILNLLIPSIIGVFLLPKAKIVLSSHD
ncbi:MAG: lysylphosphatidylglycerol synthase domain-containing protein [Cyclobacteriaceae bacterium]